MDFPWGTDELFRSFADQVRGLWEQVDVDAPDGGLSALISPVDPFNRSDILSPIVSVIGIVTMLMLAGVAIGAMAALLSSLLAIYYVLTEVFGYEIALAPGVADI